MALPLTLFTSVITIVGRIIIVAWWWVWRIIFLVFLTIFLLMSFIFIWFTRVAIIWRIRFVRWWVWWWWVWVRFPWYVCFSILLWQLCWSCQWRRIWNFCSDWNRLNWWHCSIGHVRTKRSRVQSWSTHMIILAPKILNFSPSSKIAFKIIVVLCLRLAHYIRYSFTNIMPRGDPVGAILWPSDSGSGDEDGPQFIRCVDGQ